MEANPQVRVFAPYWRERVMIARNLEQLPALDSLAALAGKAVAVPGQSLAGWLLIGAEGGRCATACSTKWNDGVEAARRCSAARWWRLPGWRPELQAVLRGDARFVIEPLPSPRPRDGWAGRHGRQKDATELAQALQGRQSARRQRAAGGDLRQGQPGPGGPSKRASAGLQRCRAGASSRVFPGW